MRVPIIIISTVFYATKDQVKGASGQVLSNGQGARLSIASGFQIDSAEL
jgi:hypothetical protein